MPSRLLSLCSPVPALPPAPCPFLLGCNDPPTTDEEWESIHTAIEQATDVLKALDDWDKTSNPPTHLSSRRDEALSFIRCHQNVVSPIRRIPPEIWSTIFYHYTTSVRKQGRRQFPLFVLALVCRKWRDIVYGMAPLWACPPSTRLFKHGLRPARAWPLFKAYVDRATGQPLTLDITSGDKESYDIERFARLVSLAEQWGDITARLTFPIFNSSVHLLEGELVNLRRLALTIVGDPSHKLPDDLFVVSDKLTDVSLWTTRVNYWPILPRNVLRFEGAFNGYQNFFRMFQHTAASLEECILVWDFGVRPDALQPTTPLVFQNLSRLTMQGYYLGFEQAADYFLSQITLPSLEHLTMDLTPLPRRFIALGDLFKRSSIDPGRGHCLHTLVLRGLWLSSQLDTGIHFFTLFRQTPNLVELHINGLDTGTWIELQIVQHRPILLPKLARLFLYWFGLRDEWHVDQFVQARTRTLLTQSEQGEGIKLQHVVLKGFGCNYSSRLLDQSVKDRKADVRKLRSLSSSLYNAFNLARTNGKNKALEKILEVVDKDPHTYDIRSIMDARLPSVMGHIANSELCPLIQKRAQDILILGIHKYGFTLRNIIGIGIFFLAPKRS